MPRANRCLALIEPLAVGWHAAKVSPHRPGHAVLVLGGGPIGLAVIQCLKAQGAQLIIVSEVSEIRKNRAREFGASCVVDPTKEDLVATCSRLSKGRGVAVAFDAAGVQVALNQAVDCLTYHGTLVNLALWESRPTLDLNQIVFREKKLQGVIAYERGDFEEVMQAITMGSIQPERMITNKITVWSFPLKEFNID